MYLHQDDRSLLLCEVHQAQEDVLQLDEEGVWVHGPVLPGTETGHDPLLRQKDEDSVSETTVTVTVTTASELSDHCYLEVLALEVSLDRFVRRIEV